MSTGAKVKFDLLPYAHARWVTGVERCDELIAKRIPMAVTDLDDKPVALFRDQWELQRAVRDNENWVFHETAQIVATTE